jgi:hypothetical protein
VWGWVQAAGQQAGLDHGIGHLVSMRLQKNQRLDIDMGCNE